MSDPKQINRLRLMLDQAKRVLEADAPDLGVLEKLLSDALALAIDLRDPPDPYADRSLRPGLGPNTRDVPGEGRVVRATPPEGD